MHNGTTDPRDGRSGLNVAALVVSLFSLVFSGGSLYFYSGQLKAAKDANKQNADNFRAEKRPWVGPNLPASEADHPIISVDEASKMVSWVVQLRNFGNSPALHLLQHTRICLCEGPVVDWHKIQREAESLDLTDDFQIILYNGAQVPNMGSIVNQPLEALEGLKSGSQVVLLYGRLTYLDYAGDSHETTWCIRYTPPTPHRVAGFIACPIQTRNT